MGLDSLIPTRPSEARDWDRHWLDHAALNAEMSTCLTRHTGAVVVRDRRMISSGFNGNVPGATHCVDGGCERCARHTTPRTAGARSRIALSENLRRLEGQFELPAGSLELRDVSSGSGLAECTCVHAEANAVAQCARFGARTEGAAVYCTHRPCLDCVKLIAVAGITLVVYAEDYPATYEVPPTIAMTQLQK